MPNDDIECESFTIIYIDILLDYQNKYYLHAYLDNFVYTIIDNQMIDHLAERLFED